MARVTGHAPPAPRPPTHLPLTPVRFLERAAVVFADRTAIVDGDVRIGYEEWWARCRRMAGLLAALGVRPGDRVAVLGQNGRMLLDSHVGVPLAGAVLLTLNIRLTAEELGWIVRHAGVDVLLYDDVFADLAEQLPVTTKVAAADYEDRLVDAPHLHKEIEDEYAPISLNYTSGTTGRPKGVLYHHRGAHQQALAMAFHGGLGPETVHLWTLPMFHCNGWAFTWAVTAAGGTHLCLPRVDADRVWELIRAEGVTSLNAAPTVLIDLAASERAAPLDRTVRVGTGGAPPSPSLLDRLVGLGFDVRHYYGLTETLGPSVVCELPGADRLASGERARLTARQGNANIAGTPVRVVDEDEHDVPADGEAMGQILVTGNTVALGYYRDPEATEAAFGGGWFRTGDLGVMHPDGRIELRDRAKDVIISGGENISSVEVEQALAAHDAVLESAVVAAPHERWGEVPVAFVTLVPGATITEAELVGWLRKRLPGFKTPKRIEFVDLPKTGTGKIQKFVLRDRARQEGFLG